MGIWYFVGVRRRSGELWIATQDRVLSTRSVRRLPVENRWGNDCVGWVSRVPWNRYKDAADADGDLPENVPSVEPREVSSGVGNRVVFIETKEKAPREFHIRKEDAEKHCYSRGCGGCSSWLKGVGRQPHNEKCREEIKELLKDKKMRKYIFW